MSGVLSEFKAFALKGNVIDLAVGVVIGAAFGKIVAGLTDKIIMPLVSLVLPSGNWREWAITLKENAPDGPAGDIQLLVGELLSVTIDFLIVALVLFAVVRAINRAKGPPPPVAAPTTRPCPACLEQVPLAATRCRACTSELSPA